MCDFSDLNYASVQGSSLGSRIPQAYLTTILFLMVSVFLRRHFGKPRSIYFGMHVICRLT